MRGDDHIVLSVIYDADSYEQPDWEMGARSPRFTYTQDSVLDGTSGPWEHYDVGISCEVVADADGNILTLREAAG